MIPTYNCARFLRETLATVLAQAPGPEDMQIEVVDDCSTADDPESVVSELGSGRVSFFRQPRNLGHVATFNTCLKRSTGHLVHLLHGDDVVRPGYYDAIERAYAGRPELGAAFCRYAHVDERGSELSLGPLVQETSGLVHDFLLRQAVGQQLQACAMTVRRSTYERLGGFDSRIARYGEDWEMWTRIAAHYPVWFERDVLACYRVRSESLSGDRRRFTDNMRDMRRVLELNREHLPRDRADQLTREARRLWANALLRRAGRLSANGDFTFPSAAIVEAFRFAATPGTAARAAALLAIWTARRLATPFRQRLPR
jgi:glycosyltransferase involved in cell wall biosynthesis